MRQAGMSDDESGRKGSEVSALARGIRLDLVIAVCALLVSSLATAASWWQTRVIQQQLSAQVWPYVSAAVSMNDDVVQITLENDGLGPAVLRNASISIDGKMMPSYVDLLHAILGPHMLRRVPKGEKVSLTISASSPGSVLRVSDPVVVFSLRSKHFAAPFLRGLARGTTRVCYCAIVPDTCWNSDSTKHDPQPVPSCPEITGDLLHQSADILFDRSY